MRTCMLLGLSHTRQLLLNFLWFPINAETTALLLIVIPTQLPLFVPSSQVGSAEKATILSWMAVVAASISLLLPLFNGAFSDRTRGKLGRRRPADTGGGVLAITSTFVAFLAGLGLLLIGMNVIGPAYQSLIPDRVPEQQRGMASGYMGG